MWQLLHIQGQACVITGKCKGHKQTGSQTTRVSIIVHVKCQVAAVGNAPICYVNNWEFQGSLALTLVKLSMVVTAVLYARIDKQESLCDCQ